MAGLSDRKVVQKALFSFIWQLWVGAQKMVSYCTGEKGLTCTYMLLLIFMSVSCKLKILPVKATCEQSSEQKSKAFIQGGLNRLKIGLGHERFVLIMLVWLCYNFITVFLITLFHVFH